MSERVVVTTWTFGGVSFTGLVSPGSLSFIKDAKPALAFRLVSRTCGTCIVWSNADHDPGDEDRS